MWANAQRDGRPAEYMWRPLFNAAKFAGVPETRQQVSAVSRPKFTILSGHVEEILLFDLSDLFNKFFLDCRYMPQL